MKRNTYEAHDNDNKTCLRVNFSHEDIGKYVVRVSRNCNKPFIIQFVEMLNKMVYNREGVSDRFKGILYKGSFYIVRKLIPDDQEIFIEHKYLESEDIKQKD